jgi:hypothetical protein
MYKRTDAVCHAANMQLLGCALTHAKHRLCLIHFLNTPLWHLVLPVRSIVRPLLIPELK